MLQQGHQRCCNKGIKDAATRAQEKSAKNAAESLALYCAPLLAVEEIREEC